MTAVIKVENISKQYQLGQIGSGTLFRDVERWWARTHGRPDPYAQIGQVDHGNRDGEDLWALRDVSFEVQQGEVLGIIGRNGAGKSTLLKILSRVTAPTSGQIKVKGRIASLLEVGTGFHPELTGRENIYLNGAILGMTRTEVRRKFDEIVDFAGVEQFVDTPVKRYSSGMYVRLAFAVAAHLEPEILIVDEVLAVGDAEFQKKCLGKMGEVARGGRTVLFVSHNLSAIISLCQRGLLLNRGQLSLYGSTAEVVESYTQILDASIAFFQKDDDPQQKFSVIQASLLKGTLPTTVFYTSETLTLHVTCVVRERIGGAQMAFEFLINGDECLFSSTHQDETGEKGELLPGIYHFECSFSLRMFRPGRYRIKLSSSIPNVEMLAIVEPLLIFDLYDDCSPIFKLGQNRRGLILPLFPWKVERVA